MFTHSGLKPGIKFGPDNFSQVDNILDFVERFRSKIERTFESKEHLPVDNSFSVFIVVYGKIFKGLLYRLDVYELLNRTSRYSIYRASQSLVFNAVQKMALRAFYFIRALTKES